jgi:hypothetical protein
MAKKPIHSSVELLRIQCVLLGHVCFRKRKWSLGIRHFSAGLFGTLEKMVPKVTIDQQASIAVYHHK